MSQTLPSISALESVGVDYLTATAYRPGSGHDFKATGDRLLEQSASRGNDVRPFKARDYRGYQSGGVYVGTRYDTHIIRLSSDDAREDWREVYERATNVSRIDLQLTFRLADELESYIRAEHATAISAKQGRGRRREVELRWNNVRGDTLYLGSRSSDTFGRVYDKGKEQKSDRAGVLIRQEIEYKSRTAKAVAESVYNSESEQAGITSLVSTVVQRFGLQTWAGAGAKVQCARGQTTNNEVRRRWLHNAVAPSVARLVRAGMLQETLDALGLSEYVSVKTEPVDKE